MQAPASSGGGLLTPEAPVKGGDKMSVTATPSSSRLTLDYGEEGSYSMTKLNPAATDENLLKMAQSVAVFQEGTPADVINYVETMLEND
jgi:hypothetical protein